jgi:hypothetical protein
MYTLSTPRQCFGITDTPGHLLRMILKIQIQRLVACLRILKPRAPGPSRDTKLPNPKAPLPFGIFCLLFNVLNLYAQNQFKTLTYEDSIQNNQSPQSLNFGIQEGFSPLEPSPQEALQNLETKWQSLRGICQKHKSKTKKSQNITNQNNSVTSTHLLDQVIEFQDRLQSTCQQSSAPALMSQCAKLWTQIAESTCPLESAERQSAWEFAQDAANQAQIQAHSPDSTLWKTLAIQRNQNAVKDCQSWICTYTHLDSITQVLPSPNPSQAPQLGLQLWFAHGARLAKRQRDAIRFKSYQNQLLCTHSPKSPGPRILTATCLLDFHHSPQLAAWLPKQKPSKDLNVFWADLASESCAKGQGAACQKAYTQKWRGFLRFGSSRLDLSWPQELYDWSEILIQNKDFATASAALAEAQNTLEQRENTPAAALYKVLLRRSLVERALGNSDSASELWNQAQNWKAEIPSPESPQITE